MERNREARRATVAAVNGGVLSSRRRLQRYRDSPEEDGGIEMQVNGRLRDRGSKKDRDRSSRSKRRRGERMMHVSNREEGEDSSSDSLDEEDEDDEDDGGGAVRPPPPPPPLPPHANLGPPPSMAHNHHRKSFPMTVKAARSPAAWKAADEMIGVPVPRRARSSSAKRQQEFSYSGGGGGGGEPIHRQASTSPARPSPSHTPISPSSSSASVRKKMKPITGSKHRPQKMTKSSSVSEDLEIEVAEVLFGLTRQFQPLPKPENHKSDPKDNNGLNNEAKSRVSSPVSISHQSASSQHSVLLPPSLTSNTPSATAFAPKRKRLRQVVKLEEDNSTSQAGLPSLPSTSASSKMEQEPPVRMEASSPKSEKITASPSVENGSDHADLVSSIATPIDVPQDPAKPEKKDAPELKLSTGESDDQAWAETNEEAIAPAKEIPRMDLDANLDETSATKVAPVAESSREVKFSIDLMAPSLEMQGLSDYVADQKSPVVADIEMVAKVDIVKAEELKTEKTAMQLAGEELDARKTKNSMSEDFDLRKKIDKDRRTLDLQLDFDKPDKNSIGSSKQQAQKQPQRAVKIDPKPEKAAQPASLPVPPVGGWTGSFPPYGYMGQVPSLQPVVPPGSSKTVLPNFLTPQLRPKRCASHCYIAHTIQYHRQLSRMNTFWPAAAGAAPVYGGTQYNLNAVPPSESSIFGNPSKAKTSGSMQDKVGPQVIAYTGPSNKDRTSAGNTYMEAAQRKQLVLQQAPQPGSAGNMMNGPAFIFPLNQQQATAAAAAACSGASKFALGSGNAASSSGSASSALVGSGVSGPAASMSFNYPGLSPNEARYMAILQNGAYPFPIPAPPPHRGSSAQAAMPFFNGSFYSPQMLLPPQLQQPQPPQQPSHSHAQQGHQNTSTSSSSSSSQRPPQQSQRAPGGDAANIGSSHSFPASKQRHLATQCETGSEDNPSTGSSKVSQAQKNIYSNNLAMAIHPQNFTMISPAASSLGSGGGSRNEKQQPPSQHQSMKVDLTTSQAFAMSFASFGGAAPLQGFDFTSMAQNHPLFQSLPEAARHGYQITAPAAGSTQATQHKKPHHHISDDGKSAGDRMNANMTGGEEERRRTTTSKSPASTQHPLTFSRTDNDTPISNTVGNNTTDSSFRTLNLIQAPGNGGRVSSRSSNAAPTTSSYAATAVPAPSSHQLQQQLHHQQLLQMQMQQRQPQMQHQLLNRTKTSTTTSGVPIYADQAATGSNLSKFHPMTLVGFPHALVQGGGATQSPPWKASTRGTTPAAAVSPASSTAKNHAPQQQGRSMQQPFPPPGNQTHISFGGNSSKAVAPTGPQHGVGGSNNPSLSSAASIVVGNAQSSGSKNAGGSPRTASSTKSGASQSTMAHLQQQQPVKNSPSNSMLKSSPLSNSSQSQTAPAPTASSKPQLLQSQQQMQKQQPPSQFFFSNAYIPGQASQSNGATTAGYYHQNRHLEQSPQQQQPQQNSSPGSAGNVTQCCSALTLAGAPAASAGSNTKGTTAAGLMQHHTQFSAAMAQSASGVSHTLMSVSAAGVFPYMHTMPDVSAKPAEQRPAAGNDNLHACWQPEKR